jgi:hypothetical protein
MVGIMRVCAKVAKNRKDSGTAAEETLPPGSLMIIGVAKTSHDRGFHRIKVKWLQNVVEFSEVQDLLGDFSVRDGDHHNHVGMRSFIRL